MPIYSSLDRLNAMHSLFTTQGNGRLDAGEVDALAGFHKGLSGTSQDKIHDRVVELYQGSKFSAGQKDRLRGLLQTQGFTMKELEGADPSTAAGFAKLPLSAQLERLQELGAEGSEDGVSKKVKLSSLDMITQGKLKAGLAKVEKQIMAEHGPDTTIGTAELRSIALKGSSVVGFVFEVPIYANEHDVDEAHYFNLKGQHLGSEYVGE
jgi:hypothetical protein